jgi:uncharacterized iron-regulated membrane protein
MSRQSSTEKPRANRPPFRDAPLWHDCVWNPRKVFLRKVLFQVHLCCGLAIGLSIAVMGASGSALVYKDLLDVQFNPRLLRASAPQINFSPNVLLETAHAVHPDQHVLLLDVATQPSWAFYSSANGWDDRAHVRIVYVDPATNKVLGERGLRQGALNWLMEFHTQLFAGDKGKRVLGALALMLLTMATTGLIIWWQGQKRWRDGLRVHWKARWPRRTWDLHTVLGFFATLPLALQAFTALSLTLPFLVIPAVVAILHGSMAEIDRFNNPPRSTVIAIASRSGDLNTILRSTVAAHPGHRLASIAFPIQVDDPFLVTLAGRHFDDRASQIRMAFDRYTGELLSDIETEHSSFALQTVVMLAPLHYGHIAGLWGGLFWICLGMCPSILFATGFLMWWRRVPSKRLRLLPGASTSVAGTQ